MAAAQNESALDLRDVPMDGPLLVGEPVQWSVVRAYIPYGNLIWAAVPALLTVILTYAFHPQQRSFSVADTTLMRSYHDDTVPFWVPVLVYLLLMLFIVAVEYYWFRQGKVSATHAAWASAFFCFAVLVSFVWVYVFYAFPNMLVGRTRPDFLSRCMPRPNLNPTKLYDASVCTNPDNSMVRHGFTSFPSGHSAFSAGFAACAAIYSFWTFFIRHPTTWRKRVPAPRCSATLSREVRAILYMLPVTLPWLFAVYVAASRVADNRHHPSDVVGGLVAGTLAATIGTFPAIALYNTWRPLFEEYEP